VSFDIVCLTHTPNIHLSLGCKASKQAQAMASKQVSKPWQASKQASHGFAAQKT
jgi:hypothetical protein